MDQLSAHLDRGWDLAQRGDTHGAASSARRALELSPDSPEAHNLLGYVAAMEGDCDEAMEAYQQAILLDDTYVEAMLNAAELLVHPMAEFQEAVDMCDQVLDITDFDDEIVDALLLKFEAVLAMGDKDGAAQVLSRLPEGPYGASAQCYLAGRAHHEVGNIDKARTLIARAIELDPTNADAHYTEGIMCEERGDRRGACAAFLCARQIELDTGLPPWTPNAETFLRTTERAIAKLPPELAALVEQAELYVADVPGPEVIVDGVDPRAPVLVDAFFAASSTGGSLSEAARPSVRVFIYALNVVRAVAGLDALQGAIEDALTAELRATLDDGGTPSAVGAPEPLEPVA